MKMPCHITDGPQYKVAEMSVREEMERDKLLQRIRDLLVDDLVEYKHVDWMHYNDSQLEWERAVLTAIAQYETGALDADELKAALIHWTHKFARNIVWPITSELSNSELEDLAEQDARDKWLKEKL